MYVSTHGIGINLQCAMITCVMAGLVFDESVGPDKTLEPAQTKPKVRLLEEPKQSKVHYLTQIHVTSHTMYALVHVVAPFDFPSPYDLVLPPHPPLNFGTRHSLHLD